MNKTQLLEKLKKELSFLPAEELENRLAFYSEMIDDRVEEGLSEDDAVTAIGDIDCIISQLKTDQAYDDNADIENPYLKGIYNSEGIENNAPPRSKKLSAWAIVLIVLGSPLWISLGAVAYSILISVYVIIWAVTGSLWSLPFSLSSSSLGGIALGVTTITHGNVFLGIAIIGAAIACAGLSIFAGFGCFHLTRLAVFISKTITKGVISLFRRKEKNNA